MKYVTAAEMRRIDRAAIEDYGIPGIILMENAGLKVAGHACQMNSNLEKVAIFCGKGNNGGDGFVAARHLSIIGKKVTVFLIGNINDVTGDALLALRIVRNMRLAITPLCRLKDLKRLRLGFDLLIDAIFGTGFSGECPPLQAAIIDIMNKSGLPVLSVDVPSGLDASTGKTGNICVRATRTVTFGLPKKGHRDRRGREWVGELFVENISFPRNLIR